MLTNKQVTEQSKYGACVHLLQRKKMSTAKIQYVDFEHE